MTDELSNRDGWPAGRLEVDCLPQRSEHYGDAEFLQQQLRLLDLIPRRAIIFVVLPLLATSALAGLEASYSWMLDRVAGGGNVVAALDLAANGGLGSWFCSLMLLAASLTAVLIYSIRRYRTDDYQGRYRIWRWAAVCWFLVATDKAACLRDGLRDLMISATGTPLWGDGSLWWVTLYAFALGAVGARLLMDMRSNPFAVSVLLMAGAAETTAIVARLGLILSEADGQRVMLSAGAEMLGGLALLMAMLLHARHVLLDAEGLLPLRALPAAGEQAQLDTGADRASPPSSATGDWRKVDVPHAVPQPAFQRAAARASEASASPTPSAFVPPPVNRKLTKAERRALKDRLMRERLERQR